MSDLLLGTVLDANTAGKLILGGWISNKRLLAPGLSILKRHRLTCSGCGFRSRSSKEAPHGWMIPVDLGHPALLALTEKGTCLCPICASTIASNWSVAPIEGAEGGAPGVLIWLPQIDQLALNRLALHLIGINSQQRKVDSILLGAARNIDNAMRGRAEELKGALAVNHGEKDIDFARALSMLPDNLYLRRGEIIGGVRFWPCLDFWRAQGDYWMESTIKGIQKDSGL